MECLMQFFHFKEIPPASSPNNEFNSLALSSGQTKKPNFGVTFVRSNSIIAERSNAPLWRARVDSKAARSGDLKVLWQVLPRSSLMDSGVKQ